MMRLANLTIYLGDRRQNSSQFLECYKVNQTPMFMKFKKIFKFWGKKRFDKFWQAFTPVNYIFCSV